jgi:hypothetical protein
LRSVKKHFEAKRFIDYFPTILGKDDLLVDEAVPVAMPTSNYPSARLSWGLSNIGRDLERTSALMQAIEANGS